ncbi:MAG TPA: AAA family ATPase [Acidimicrobiales bacterium]|nr:AAA family ATPase [Acidimicrobiales bacterium]
MPEVLDPELSREQEYLNYAHACLKAMRERAEALEVLGGNRVTKEDLTVALAKRIASLQDSGRALCFGRIDHDEGTTWYVGRRHVEDDAADPVVIEWRAPVALPFYRARPAEPLGLRRRRQFVVDGSTLLSISDDHFDGRVADAPRVRGRDALLVELERGRTGSMLDIVATIQVEQDEVIRLPQPGIVAVQGGPGTGKTAVGLHRAAFLLYGNDALARAGVLVVGPNRTFLRYIAQVLPSLGEEAVVQATLTDLVPEVRVRAVDDLAAARIKGDPRMYAVINAALALRRRSLDGELEVRVSGARLRLAATAVDALVDGIVERAAPYNAGRAALREQMARAVLDANRPAVERLGIERAKALDEVRRDSGYRDALDRVWPTASAATVVRELLTSPTALGRAASGILSGDEQAAVLAGRGASGRSYAWTDADAVLVDAAKHAIDGTQRTYGHAVVDEAQDLSPMQLRMLARRCPSGSMTILGDIAQGFGPWAFDGWEDAFAFLPAPDGTRVEELRLGYRTPGPVLELASRLLPAAAPQIEPTEAVRDAAAAPSIIDAGRMGDLPAAAASEASRLIGEGFSVAVIVPQVERALVAKAIAAAGLDAGSAETDGLDHAVTLVAPAAVRGLEFDAVVVIEPASIVAEGADRRRGLRLLYVALTRPTRHLSVVHAGPLPEELTE